MHEVGFTLRVGICAHLHECLRERADKIRARLWLQGIRTCPCVPAHGAIMSSFICGIEFDTFAHVSLAG